MGLFFPHQLRMIPLLSGKAVQTHANNIRTPYAVFRKKTAID